LPPVHHNPTLKGICIHGRIAQAVSIINGDAVSDQFEKMYFRNLALENLGFPLAVRCGVSDFGVVVGGAISSSGA
jgi:hypothetical protein